jgi:hypothetical protein
MNFSVEELFLHGDRQDMELFSVSILTSSMLRTFAKNVFHFHFKDEVHLQKKNLMYVQFLHKILNLKLFYQQLYVEIN